MAIGLLVTFGCALSGCKPREQITRYQVPKPDQVGPDEAQSAPSGPPTDRTLAAMTRQGDIAWFFKIVGPVEELEQQRGRFVEFLQSLRFEDDKPVWSLPEGWTMSDKASSMRFATIEIGDDSDVEMSVIPLPVGGESWKEYVVMNVNRWRGELSLPNVSRSEIDEQLEEIEAGDLAVTLVDIQGHRARSSGRAPFASMGARPSAPASRPSAPTATSIKFEAPGEWEQGERVVSRGGIQIRREAAFVIEENGKQAEVTITALPGPAALTANVNRWRRQIGLGPATAEEIAAEAKPVDVGGVEGQYVVLEGAGQSTLGVIASSGGKTWFIKLTADPSLARREQDRFEAFVDSIEFAPRP